MAGLLFVSQQQLDAWLESGVVDVTASGMTLPAERRTLELRPAWRFLSLLEGEDVTGLLSKVRTDVEIRALGGDPCGDSILLGEVAYQVEPGFLALVQDPACAGSTPGLGAPQRNAVKAGAPEEASLLSEFLLGQLK